MTIVIPALALIVLIGVLLYRLIAAAQRRRLVDAMQEPKRPPIEDGVRLDLRIPCVVGAALWTLVCGGLYWIVVMR